MTFICTLEELVPSSSPEIEFTDLSQDVSGRTKPLRSLFRLEFFEFRQLAVIQVGDYGIRLAGRPAMKDHADVDLAFRSGPKIGVLVQLCP